MTCVAVEKDSLAFKTEAAFIGRDHVGAVRQLDGIELSKLISIVRETLLSYRLEYEEELLASSELYTCVSRLPFADDTYLWVKGVQVKVGVVVDVKVIHRTEESAIADEFLTKFLGMLESKSL